MKEKRNKAEIEEKRGIEQRWREKKERQRNNRGEIEERQKRDRLDINKKYRVETEKG